MLLLRTVAGAILVGQGVVCVTGPRQNALGTVIGVLVLLTAVAVLFGLLTPILSLLAALECVGIAFSWVSVPIWNLLDSRLALLELAAMCAGIFFLGPGAFSLDARLFGWREIVIPPTDISPR